MGVMDFSPLGRLGRDFISGYDSGRSARADNLIAEEMVKASPDYRRAAGYAFEGGNSGSALALLGMGQKAEDRILARQAAANAADVFANLDGDRPAMRPLASLGAGSTPPSSGGAANNGAPPGLIPSESGNRWDAQNSAVGAGGKVGHFGRIQFGQERLQDAMNAGAIPQGTTPQQFMNSPELQQQAERWHWADIENSIRQNGLDRMIGQNINGVPVTMDGMKAVAHLGGSEGLKKFIETGGRYNPADVNGTRLSDYFSRMGGNGGVAVQANARPSGDVYDDPNVPDQGPGVPLAYKAGPGVAPSRIDQDDTAAPQSWPIGNPSTWTEPGMVPQSFQNSIARRNIAQLSRLLTNPNLPEDIREVAKLHLATRLNNAEKIPEDIKAFLWARSNNETTAKTYQEWKALGKEEKDPGAKIKAEAAARREEANRLGLREGSPERTRYIAEGKIGADEKPDHKAIGEADAAITSAQEALNSIREAKSLSAKAYDGAFADLRGAVAANFGSEGGVATLNLNNVVQTGALAQLKSIFGGNPTEGERKILLEVSGSANQPRAVRDAIFDRAEKAIERRLGIAMNKAAELRDRSYYKPGGGQSGRATAPQANAGSAAPKAAPGARYDELVGQGLTKQQAYQRMHEEGY